MECGQANRSRTVKARRTPKRKTFNTEPQPATPLVDSEKRQKHVTAQLVTKKDVNAMDRYVHEYIGRWEHEAVVMADLQKVAKGITSSSSRNSRMLGWCVELRRFIVAYGIHRTFKGLSKSNTTPLAPIVRHIQRRWASGELQQRQGDARFIVREVEALADVCKAAGFARNLSFATKALNMLGLRVPIFSSECVAFLRLPRAVSYDAFHTAWTAQYMESCDALKSAAAKHASTLLPWSGEDIKRPRTNGTNLRRPSATFREGRSDIEAAAAWLSVRALDVRMLREGGPMR